MKLDNRLLTLIHESALSEIMDKAKGRDETHEQFRTRCFMNGLIRTMSKEGYDVTLFNRATVSIEPFDVKD